jgi:hypothetical protein
MPWHFGIESRLIIFSAKNSNQYQTKYVVCDGTLHLFLERYFIKIALSGKKIELSPFPRGRMHY